MRFCGRENREARVSIRPNKNSALPHNKADIPHLAVYPLSVAAVCLPAVASCAARRVSRHAVGGPPGRPPVLLPGDDPGAAEHRRHRRFVQRPVDGGHLGSGQVDVGGAGVLLHPLHLAGAGDRHDPGALAEHPGQRDLRRGAVFLGGQPVQQRQQPVAFILPRRAWSGKFRLVHKYIPKGGFPA